jgi:imidazolonepropionase-like amidohydrolase
MSEAIVFRNAFLIDGNGGDPLPEATVVVVDTKIREVSADGKGIKVANTKAIDLKGKTLMPELIDAHVHPNIFDLNKQGLFELFPIGYVHRTTRNLETDLDLGFTTLRDASALDLGFRTAIDQGLIRGPRLLPNAGAHPRTDETLRQPSPQVGRRKRADPGRSCS